MTRLCRYGDNAFFVLDTTTHRLPIAKADDPSVPEPTLLGTAQVAELFSWAAKVARASGPRNGRY